MNKSFTLIEILVVIVIIGIISAFIIVSMAGVSSKANIAKSQAFANSLRNSLLINLVSEWKFDELSSPVTQGTTIQDSWGGGNNGTVTSNDSNDRLRNDSDCVSGKCLYFDGGDYVNCGTNSNLEFGTTSFTMAAWFKTPNHGSGAPIMGKGHIGTTNDKYGMRFIAANRICIDFADGTNGGQCFLDHTGSFNVSDNKWHFAVTTINRTTQKILTYLDTKYVAQADISSMGSVASALYFGIGAYGGSGGFQGYVDGIAIYGEALSTSQAQESYYSGLNRLLANSGIEKQEYARRINEFLAQN
ncbi:MAG: LamG domain-containing protein [Candidatus Paceibacterota bacterium]|jgi:prepilin-type N-terminal cleavage/methylation domain-containing protein|nr:LamG domain-containing protein [Candidatus Paceibacterota bacterium]